MNDLDIPILKKAYDLYKTFHDYRKVVPKTDRFTIYERGENLILGVIERFIEVGYAKQNKASILEQASLKLNILRFMVRLMKESRTFDLKKYTVLQEQIDEIGRMLGGWLRANTLTR